MGLGSPVCGQLYIPPDLYGDEHQGSNILRRNDNQVVDTDQQQRPDVRYYFEGSPVGIYLRDSSRVSFAYHLLHNDSITPDTAFRVDMTLRGAKMKVPLPVDSAPGIANFYRGVTVAEQVPAFHRGVYPAIRNGVDLHVYGSGSGPRIALVLHPGADTSFLKLAFTGQDSLHLDWMGALRMYVKDHWFELRQGVAYQVDANGSTLPVTWQPTYAHQAGTSYVGFTFGSFNPSLPLVVQIGYGPVAMGGGPDQRNLGWSTFMGGTGGDELTCVESDPEGNPYSCGHTWAPDFPVDPGNSQFDPAIGEFSGNDDAVIMKFAANNKQLVWATYYAGSVPAMAGSYAITEAQKLALGTNTPYVFAVGTTNCIDFAALARPFTPFANASQELYLGGQHRMWVGAFSTHNGVCDWATTHGQNSGYTWKEEGLSIAVDATAGVAVGGRLVGNAPDFEAVTPAGAFHRPTGGAFVVLFEPLNYTIRWASAFGGHPLPGQPPHTQVSDMRFVKKNGPQKLWITGMSIGDNAYWDGLDYTLPTQLPNGDPLPPDAFYHDHGMAFLASFDVTSLHLDYCTGWGQGTATSATDLMSAAYGLDYDGQHLWMVGGTHALTLTNADCPVPGGTGVHHTPVNGGGMDDYAKCDGFILAFDPATYQLKYGTLLGGYNYDMLLDVAHDAEHIYITGETRSHTHYTTDLDPDRYFQPLNPNGSSRDAVIIALAKNMASPTLLWQTPFGGHNSERGWGVATNATELYLTGGTASSFWDDHPLKEFDLDDDLDFFQNIHFGGNAYSFLDYWQFEYGLDGAYSTPVTNPEPTQQPHDGFIASFDLQYQNTLGTSSPTAPARNLVVNPQPAEGQWAVHFPELGDWTVMAYDAAGHQVGMWHTSNTSLVVDLTARSSGLYLLVASDRAGARYPAKIVRP